MDLETALQARSRIATFLNADGVKRRAPRPRVAIGIAPGVSSMFQIAIRAPSQKDLDRALGDGAAAEVKAMAEYEEMDVQITGEVSAAPALEPPDAAPLAIGSSVGHYNCTAGSLGFFAQRLSDSAVGFVSNNHVVADCDRGKSGDDVLYPGPADRGDRAADVVASLGAGYPILQGNGVVVDAAFAQLRDGVSFDAGDIGGTLRLQQMLVPLFRQREVLKFGRSTGLTRGRITAFALQNLDIVYPSLDKRIFFERQIEITSVSETEPFSKRGDSGSLVVNPDGNPIGLLFAMNGNGRYAYANPIGDVLRELNVRLLA